MCMFINQENQLVKLGLFEKPIIQVMPLGKIIVKGTTQVSGHSLKLHFCMFKISQRKHNSLNCHNFFGNIFY
jgi:hypothetical protein